MTYGEEGTRTLTCRQDGRLTDFMTAEIMTDAPSLVLRLLREEDTEELSLLLDKNREHLRRLMPWLDGAKSPSEPHSSAGHR